MPHDVLCLRPEGDFIRAGVTPPVALTIAYRRPDDPEFPALIKSARALVIPAVGGKLPGSVFDGSQVKLVQVTGAGVDRVDKAAMKKLGIAVANVPGGSNSAVAEYTVGCAIVLLRRLAWSSREILDANYVTFRGRMIADNLPGLEGLTVGAVGMGTVGIAVAEAFHRFGCQIVYCDPAPPDTDNPLFALEGDAARRVLFTPHIADVTRQASATLFREAWANVERVLVRKEEPLYRVY